MTQDLIDKSFNALYTSLPYTKVKSFEDMLLYWGIPIGMNTSMREELEAKIKELNLPLYVEPKSTNSIFMDTICVKPVL